MAADSAKGARRLPSSIYYECEECGETLHGVLKGRESGRKLHAVLRCGGCGMVTEATLSLVPDISVPMVVSWLSESEKTMVSLPGDERISVGDELIAGDSKVKVTGIESGGKRVSSAPASGIDTLWAKKFELVMLRASIHEGAGRVKSVRFFSQPDDTIAVGDDMEFDGRTYRIFSLRTVQGTLRKGSASARDVVRLYLRKIRRTRTSNGGSEGHTAGGRGRRRR